MRKDTEFLVRADKDIMDQLLREANTLGISKAELIRKSICLMFEFLRRHREILNKQVVKKAKKGEPFNLEEMMQLYQEEMNIKLREIENYQTGILQSEYYAKKERFNNSVVDDFLYQEKKEYITSSIRKRK